MSMKHTAGPWKCSVDPRMWGDAIFIHSETANVLVAEVNRVERLSTGKPTDRLADGMLIASAPDLLAACQYVLEFHDIGEHTLSGDSADTLRAAIKKALDR